MGYTIRQLNAADIPLALELFSWLKEPNEHNDVPPVDAVYAATVLLTSGFYAIAALHNGTVVGGLTAYALPMHTGQFAEMFLYEIGVEEAHQRHGIATALIAELKRICHEKHIKTMFVGTSVDNAAARKLYETTGGELDVIPWYTYTL
jgi:aminoglycoside 3-N-acetyltransferase I